MWQSKKGSWFHMAVLAFLHDEFELSIAHSILICFMLFLAGSHAFYVLYGVTLNFSENICMHFESPSKPMLR